MLDTAKRWSELCLPSRSLFSNPFHKTVLLEEMSLLELAAIEAVSCLHRGKRFLFPVLPVSLENCWSSSHSTPQKTKMIASIIPFLEIWYVTFYLQDSYFHMARYPGHRKDFQFIEGYNHYTLVPLGLSSALRAFTKCTFIVPAYLCCDGIQIFLYLDDWLVQGKSSTQVQNSILVIRQLFSCLGLKLNMNESKSKLTQQITIIGADISATIAYLPADSSVHGVSIPKPQIQPKGNSSFLSATTGSHGIVCVCDSPCNLNNLCCLQACLQSVYWLSRHWLGVLICLLARMLQSLGWRLDSVNVCKKVPFLFQNRICLL